VSCIRCSLEFIFMFHSRVHLYAYLLSFVSSSIRCIGFYRGRSSVAVLVSSLPCCRGFPDRLEVRNEVLNGHHSLLWRLLIILIFS
jgi:hypothetical protein